MIEIKRESYTLCLEDPSVYVDNEARGRSGHMTHAMTKLNNGSYINFNSNCSAERSGGHSTYGWLEYRFSNDSGKTYSEAYEFPYAKESFLSGTVSISVEKMVTCDNGRVIAFCLRNYAYEELCCEPWSTPTFVTSDDNCKTWSEPKEIADSSITPHIVTLKDDVLLVVYGRPGVHCKVSFDKGNTWSDSYSIIGKTLTEERNSGKSDAESKYFDTSSYSNTFVEKISDNEVLVCYNNLKYPDKNGVNTKAVFVKKISLI
jgi:hypothetical protein